MNAAVTFAYKFTGIYLAIKMLAHTGNLCLSLRNCQAVTHGNCTVFYPHALYTSSSIAASILTFVSVPLLSESHMGARNPSTWALICYFRKPDQKQRQA